MGRNQALSRDPNFGDQRNYRSFTPIVVVSFFDQQPDTTIGLAGDQDGVTRA
jgi:hypothetical protein